MTNETETIIHAEALRREAVGFAEWCLLHCKRIRMPMGVVKYRYSETLSTDARLYNIQELYDLYRKSKEKEL